MGGFRSFLQLLLRGLSSSVAGGAPPGVDGPYRVVAASIIAPGQQAGAAFTPGPVARLVTSPGSAAGQIGGQT
jgi:hypothetical protein